MGQAVQELIEIRVENEELQLVIDEYEKEFEENK